LQACQHGFGSASRIIILVLIDARKAASLLHFQGRRGFRPGTIAPVLRASPAHRASAASSVREKNLAKLLTQKKCVDSFRRNASQRTKE